MPRRSQTALSSFGDIRFRKQMHRVDSQRLFTLARKNDVGHFWLLMSMYAFTTSWYANDCDLRCTKMMRRVKALFQKCSTNLVPIVFRQQCSVMIDE
jgi:hypothetical protein